MLDVAFCYCAGSLKLLSSRTQSLLCWRNSFRVMDLRLNVVDGVICLDVESDGPTCERLDKYLHLLAVW